METILLKLIFSKVERKVKRTRPISLRPQRSVWYHKQMLHGFFLVDTRVCQQARLTY